jgi:hypothetical protein
MRTWRNILLGSSTGFFAAAIALGCFRDFGPADYFLRVSISAGILSIAWGVWVKEKTL